MIDTVRFRIPESMDPKLLADWDYSFRKRKDGRTKQKYIKYIEGPSGNPVRITYYPQSIRFEPIPIILVEASLPRVVNGNNIKMLDDVIPAIKLLETLIIEPLNRKVDLFKAEIDRIDLCYNHYVGEHVADYIKHLFKVEHPTKRTKPYYPTYGVQFYSSSICLIFYDKHMESKDVNAAGILREEISCVTKASVRSILGSQQKPAFITDFTVPVIEKILTRENEKLGINDVVIAEKALALKVLIAEKGPEQGLRLFGHLCASDFINTKEMRDLGMSKQTISRNNVSIANVNLATRLGNQEAKLLPLTIDLQSFMK